ncbi:chaperone DnaJ [Uncinocarpus reesii 1704]|uniref:Chaperone DnaJ n=1 Tax=Uncinocarpus reesii (strain UAMH 1704) TaxID=336963 RepID=C4JWN5_UNCRE|nr:chaperone DnaJ [Uncinocarpus reesii 1704]EEP82112.1 chaperone DnaJ [Uncinocarpus reesii 1704]
MAEKAEKRGDWETCVSQAGVAILKAGTSLPLRQRRARCRFERGEIQEGISDLAHVLQISPGYMQPHLEISAMLFYSLADTDRGLTQIRKCLHSDPDSKVCSGLFRRQKQISKLLQRLDRFLEQRKFNKAVELLVGSKEESGLIDDVKNEIKSARANGYIHKNAPEQLSANLVEKACEAYREMNSKRKAKPFCSEALEFNPTSLHGLLSKAESQLDSGEYEAAMQTLAIANENHPHTHAVRILHEKAQTLLKRSKQKDYYKVLGVDREADDATIKRAYRKLTKQYHPDKVRSQGVSKEDAEKKMAAINEAYEVLADSELRARFDRGDDPNNPENNQGNPFHSDPFGPGGGGQQFFFHHGAGGQQFKFSQQGFPGGFPFG